ncbi:MAG: hypothetical protein CMO47_00595 [Verrucomicrobiales bacterium]|nr:hypothetical protein [Verrucomicrobiales bacterium]
MAKRNYTYTGNVYEPSAGTKEFELTSSGGKEIEYLEKTHISVAKSTDSGDNWTTLSRPSQWDFSSDGKKAVLVTGTDAGDWIRVKRNTPFDDRYTTFQASSNLTSNQLNDGEDFSLYVDQEIADEIVSLDGTILGPAVKEIIGELPVEVDSSNQQKPVISVDVITKTEAEKDPTNPSWDTEKKLASPAAIDRIYKQIVGSGSSFPGTGNKAKLGQLRIDNTGSIPILFYWDTTAETWVELKIKGQDGPKGDPGPPPGLQDPAASATNVPLDGDSLGTATASVTQDSNGDLKFAFGVPVGLTGAKGEDGKDSTVAGPEGDAATIAVGVTSTLAPGEDATVTNAGSSSAAVFNFGIPKGEKGETGEKGEGVDYKGPIDATSDPEPTTKANGDLYLNVKKGTSSWAGEVEVNSRIIWNERENKWDVYGPVQGYEKVSSVNSKVGDVVLTHTDVGAASKAQGEKADTALQPGNNVSQLTNDAKYITEGSDISKLNNDAGYVTSSQVPGAAPVKSVNDKTGEVVLTASDVGAATEAQGKKADSALQSGDDISKLNNDAGFITASDVPAQKVTSVNTKTGAVVLTAADVQALPLDWSSLDTLP